ncbi:DUF4176 domain-containing protein [Clostridiaceae bacterium]|nr:DUF4176 domain-containing protein [Clostridiaceae bacterium]RKI17358.1 DUF4176 domain-containing protein [bacterium 1XD21-70]
MKDLLPIGSVVLLKNASKRLMICGRIQVDLSSGEQKVYHYSGCLYPEGLLDPNKLYLFNNGDIDKVFYLGMQDEEEFKFRNYIIQKISDAQEKKKDS